MKKIFNTIVFIIILFTLSGCFNYKEINDYAIVSGISIDENKGKSVNKYKVGIQIMNAKKDEESDSSLITFYEASGKTIYDALEKIMLDSPKELYLGHNEVVVISEELLKKENPLNYLDYFMRDPGSEKDSAVMVSKEKDASSILKVITPLETLPSKNLRSTLSVADNFSGILTVVTIDEFISDLSNPKTEAIIPSVKIEGKVKKGEMMDNIQNSDPKTKLTFDTLGYFKDNKLKGYLTANESVGYNFLANFPKETYINVKCDKNNYATLRINSNKFKEKFYYEGKTPVVNVNIKVNADLLEYNCKTDFLKNKNEVKKLENKAKKRVNKLMNQTISKLYKEEKTDTLKYGEKFYTKKYKETKNLKYNTKDIIEKAKFKFNTKVSIKSTELTIKSVRKENSNE